jgi:type III restriction enzyme
VKLNKGRYLSEDFRELWERISHKTRYQVEFTTQELVARSARLLQDEPEVAVPQITVAKSEVKFTAEGVEEAPRAFRPVALADYRPAVPDIIGYLQRETELTRTTLVEILVASGRTAQALKNPQAFMEQAAGAIQHAKRELMVDGVRYERIEGQSYEMRLFENDEIESYLSRLLEVGRSIYDAIEYDSEVERKFAADLDANEEVRLFVKLPRWFVVKTPLGDYRPDWAIVRERDGKVYLVAETKGTKDRKALPDAERLRTKCGERHFGHCLKVPYKLATQVSDLD